MKEIDLKTLCTYTNDNDDLLKYFYKMSHSMKKLHDSGYYITDFRSDKIVFDDKSNEFIFRVNKVRPDIKDEVIKSNIYNYASLLTNIYINKSNLFNSDMLFSENYLKEVVENFKYSYNDIDYNYFYNLYKNNDVVYYHEYIDAVKKEQNGISNSKNLVKATSVGAMLSNDDSSEVFNKAAFISVPVVFVMAAVLILFMIVIFVITNT
ncbi:MAG: hypothetical protein ACI4OT_01170 [Bacilli bacterium]